MKALFIEVPLLRVAPGDSLAAVKGEVPPLQLLCCAEQAAGAGCEVAFLPDSDAWDVLPSNPDAGGAALLAQITASEAEVVFLSLHSFNRPLVSALLDQLRKAFPENRPFRIALCGMSAGVLRGTEDWRDSAVDAVFGGGDAEDVGRFIRGRQVEGGDISGPGSADGQGRDPRPCLLASTKQLANWPRWDSGLQTSDPFGFPLLFQPHPWNLPRTPPLSPDAVKLWLGMIGDGLAALREPRIWFSSLAGYGLELMDKLGEFSFDYIKQHGVAPQYGVRATPSQLSSPAVLSNLAVLNVTRVDLLVGSGSESWLKRRVEQHALEQARECARRIKEVGLAAHTRLLFVLGLPGEQMSDATETVNFSTGVAVENSISEIKFEWWLNVPDSEFYEETGVWEESMNGSRLPWFADAEVLRRVPSGISPEDRKVLNKTIEVLRAFHSDLRILGPDVL